jgi:hypothetical protein
MRSLANWFSVALDTHTPPRLSFGPNWGFDVPETNRGSATTMARQPVFVRLTSSSDFLKEAILMAKADYFHGTACSTVNDLVAGLALTLNPGRRQVDMPIGSWESGNIPTAAARQAIETLAELITRSTVNPTKMRVGLQRMQVLESVLVEDVRFMDIVMYDMAAVAPARMSDVAKAIYDHCERLRQAKQRYVACRQEQVEGVLPMHFFGAMIVHRLNPMLLADGMPHFWDMTQDGHVRRISSRMMLPVGDEGIVVGESAPEDEATLGDQAYEADDGGQGYAAKRARMPETLSWEVQGHNISMGAFSKAAPQRPSTAERAAWYLRAKPKEMARSSNE